MKRSDSQRRPTLTEQHRDEDLSSSIQVKVMLKVPSKERTDDVNIEDIKARKIKTSDSEPGQLNLTSQSSRKSSIKGHIWINVRFCKSQIEVLKRSRLHVKLWLLHCDNRVYGLSGWGTKSTWFWWGEHHVSVKDTLSGPPQTQLLEWSSGSELTHVETCHCDTKGTFLDWWMKVVCRCCSLQTSACCWSWAAVLLFALFDCLL